MKAEDVLIRLEKQFNENINSHVFLVETNNIDNCTKDIKKIIKNKINASEITSHQIDEENYLELIIIKPDGKDIKREQILNLQERIKTKPILSDYIFYIIINAECLTEISSNKLLKTIEEPNDNVIGFLITNNSSQIINTIKSRCELCNIMYNEHEVSIKPDNSILEISQKLVIAIETNNHVDFSLLKAQEKIIKDNTKTIANLIKDYYNMASNLKKNDFLDVKMIEYIQKHNSYSQLIRKTKYINSFLNTLIENMNSDLLLESIFLNLKDVK